MNKKVIFIIGGLLYILSTYFSYSFFAGSSGLLGLSGPINYVTPKVGNAILTEDPEEPKTEACPLNGAKYGKSQRALWETRRPLGIMIENHTEARPQSGLTSADIIYEVVAEGGITRFLAVYYCKDTAPVGPVRSARVYFLDFIAEYGENPLYVHVGGANCNRTTGSGCANGAPADALGRLNKIGWTAYNDLNHISFPVMWRDYERLPGVATEHTVYSTTVKLWEYAKKDRKLTNVDEDGKKWNADFDEWKFKEDEPASSPIAKINFGFWKGKSSWDVEWQYDKTTNSYKRLNGDELHLDKNNNKQIVAKNVLVVFMDESVAKDGYDAGQHLLYDTKGSGDGIFFMDGEAFEGTWKKTDAFSRMKIYNSSGKELELNGGQIFIEILPTGNKVTY